MEANIMEAYKALVPIDQLVVDAMIVALYNKDKEIKGLVTEVHKMLDKQESN